MKAKYIPVVVVLILGAAWFSAWCAKSTYLTDFGSFYRTGHIVLDDTRPVTDVYMDDDPDISKYGIPDNEVFILFRYSMLAAYTFAPLAWFSYDTANAIFIFANIVAYILSVVLVLHAGGAKERWFVYPLLFSLFWMPFIQNSRWGQSNAIITLFVTLGILGAYRNRNLSAGITLAVATLFKPLALAITMVLCLKNWRIAISYVVLISTTLIVLPGAMEWFHSFLWPPHPWFCYSAIYLLLNPLSPYYFWIYALSIGGITAFVTYTNRYKDYLVIGSLAIPAALLATPVLEIQYPTLMIFTYAFLITRNPPIGVKLLSTASFIIITAGSLTTQTPWVLFAGIFVCWVAMLSSIMWSGRSISRSVPN